jgi:hypothetical protein
MSPDVLSQEIAFTGRNFSENKLLIVARGQKIVQEGSIMELP